MQNSYRGRGYRGGRTSSRYQPHRGRARRGPAKQVIDPARFIKKASETISTAYEITHSFSDFGLDPRLAANITKAGFSAPLPIQDQAIPLALAGRDVIGLANTGTGKTAAFMVPLLHKQLQARHLVLIMAPTRELAIQIENDFRLLGAGLGLYSALCVGGQSMWKQRHALERRPHFVIGTPGRLKDLIDRRLLRLENCHSLVLDEVDRMVDMGFINDIKHILTQVPAERQSLFFTATVSPKVETIARSFLNDPVKVSVTTGETADGIEQDIVKVNVGENKFDKLHQLLAQNEITKALVFGETKYGVERINKELASRGIRSVSIHGNKTQGQRQRALLQFRSGEASVMVATDVAARGLDIKEISHVINYDTPQTYDDYIHRIGRAGRAGNKGYALTFVP